MTAQCLWVNVECMKCGKADEKKYCVDTLDNLDKFFTLTCSCGNKDCEHFRLVDMDVSRGKIL